MTSKGLLRRQVLVSISLSNSTKFMVLSYKHVENINRALKNIKFNIMTDFIWADYQSLIIMTSKVILSSDLSTIEKVYQEYRCYWIRQHYGAQTFSIKVFIPITSNTVERIIKSMYIFNDVVLVSKPRVIKASSKSDMVVIWVDIWNMSEFKMIDSNYFLFLFIFFILET